MWRAMQRRWWRWRLAQVEELMREARGLSCLAIPEAESWRQRFHALQERRQRLQDKLNTNPETKNPVNPIKLKSTLPADPRAKQRTELDVASKYAMEKLVALAKTGGKAVLMGTSVHPGTGAPLGAMLIVSGVLTPADLAILDAMRIRLLRGEAAAGARIESQTHVLDGHKEGCGSN